MKHESKVKLIFYFKVKEVVAQPYVWNLEGDTLTLFFVHATNWQLFKATATRYSEQEQVKTGMWSNWESNSRPLTQ